MVTIPVLRLVTGPDERCVGLITLLNGRTCAIATLFVLRVLLEQEANFPPAKSATPGDFSQGLAAMHTRVHLVDRPGRHHVDGRPVLHREA